MEQGALNSETFDAVVRAYARKKIVSPALYGRLYRVFCDVVERALIETVIRHHNGDKQGSAAVLGISLDELDECMKRLNITEIV